MDRTELALLLPLVPAAAPWRPLPAVDPLVALLREGHRHAIAHAYDEHAPALRAFAKRVLGDAAAAEDVVHELFMNLPRIVERFRGDSSLRTFLLSSALNYARHAARASGRRNRAMDRFATEVSPSPANPEASTARAELADELSRAIAELPWDQRVAFVLCDVEERSSQEVARIVEAPEATVRTRLFHARRKLREALEKRGVR